MMDSGGRKDAVRHTDLNRSLHAFLAEERRRGNTAEAWHRLKELVLRQLGSAHEQTIRSTFVGLSDARGCVDDDEWTAFRGAVRRKLCKEGNSELLDFFLSDNFVQTGALTKENSPLKRRASAASNAEADAKRPRARSPYMEGLANSNSKNTEKTIFADTFYILKTSSVLARNHSIALDEIIIAGASLAVVCNYKLDFPWMWEHAPAFQATQKLLIVHGESETEETEWKSFLAAQGASDRVRFARPRTPPYGTVHSKIFLLFFESGCRICIHTANMIDVDWNYKTQGAYVRDFPIAPPLNNGELLDAETPTISDFAVQLKRYFEHALVEHDRRELMACIERYDFSSSGVSLVSSVPGMHKDASKDHFGHARLRKLLQKEKFPNQGAGSVAICQFSSLGSIQEKWLEGEFKESLFSSAEQQTGTPQNSRRARHHEIKLVYPTTEQVRNSNEGLSAGASLPVSAKNLHRDHIMNKLHKWDGTSSGREHAMPHIKTFLRYNADNPSCPLWCFIGSFNLSVAAWGRMQGAKKGKWGWNRLNILSYEMGVLFTLTKACPPSFHLQPSVNANVLSIEDVAMWKSLKSRGALSFRLEETLIRPNKEDHHFDFHKTRVACGVLVLPIPYAVPPPKFSEGDIPWNTSFCAMV